jgi:hypothetical protein
MNFDVFEEFCSLLHEGPHFLLFLSFLLQYDLYQSYPYGFLTLVLGCRIFFAFLMPLPQSYGFLRNWC